MHQKGVGGLGKAQLKKLSPLGHITQLDLQRRATRVDMLDAHTLQNPVESKNLQLTKAAPLAKPTSLAQARAPPCTQP
jgi:hypothetical protein